MSAKDISDQAESVFATTRWVARIAEELEIAREAVVLAWLMRHPAVIQSVIGTTRPERIRA